MKSTVKCCGTCVHSRWPLTPTGKVKRDALGKCAAPLIDISKLLPDSITHAYGYHIPASRSGIGEQQGENCPSYQLNEGKPLSNAGLIVPEVYEIENYTLVLRKE